MISYIYRLTKHYNDIQAICLAVYRYTSVKTTICTVVTQVTNLTNVP
jgi:hypothetical protein